MKLDPYKVEVWAPIPGFDGYEVSSFGQVRSRWQTLKATPNSRGYLQVTLYYRHENGYKERKDFKVHFIVMLTFVGPRPEGLGVAHRDGIKSNNRLSNLKTIGDI